MKGWLLRFGQRSIVQALTGASCVLVLLLGTTGPGRANVIFDWVCDDPTCNGDPTFEMVWEFTDAAVASGDFTGVAGNIVSIFIQSGVGDGYTNSLADLLPSHELNMRVVFNAARDLVIELENVDPTIQSLVFSGTEGLTNINDGLVGTGYFIDSRRDFLPTTVANTDNIFGRLVRRDAPEPSTVMLFATGLVGLAILRRRRQPALRPAAAGSPEDHDQSDPARRRRVT